MTVHGFAGPEGPLRRDAARIGDDVWVSGTLGDAAAALAQWRDGGTIDPALRVRLDRPEPRVALGGALAGIAHACIDVSDGLLADLGHACVASGVGAVVDVDRLPASPVLHAAFDGDARRVLQATGGDDYELCFTAAATDRPQVEAAARAAAVAVTRVGNIREGHGVEALDADGSPWQAERGGHVHFGA